MEPIDLHYLQARRESEGDSEFVWRCRHWRHGTTAQEAASTAFSVANDTTTIADDILRLASEGYSRRDRVPVDELLPGDVVEICGVSSLVRKVAVTHGVRRGVEVWFEGEGDDPWALRLGHRFPVTVRTVRATQLRAGDVVLDRRTRRKAFVDRVEERDGLARVWFAGDHPEPWTAEPEAFVQVRVS